MWESQYAVGCYGQVISFSKYDSSQAISLAANVEGSRASKRLVTHSVRCFVWGLACSGVI